MGFDHAGDRISCKSQTGILLYCIYPQILYYSKIQNNIKSSTFGS